MKRNILFIIGLVIITSCLSDKLITKKDYVFNDNSKRKLILTFQDDSTCTLRNIYMYEKSENNELVINCRYKVISIQYLMLISNDISKDSIGKGYFNFPNLEKSDSPLLKDKKQIFGPNYSTDYERYTKVPYIDGDTLIKYKGKLIWIKKDKNNKVVGYYEFK